MVWAKPAWIFIQNSFKPLELNLKQTPMNNIFKGLIAGYGASKVGGGCLVTIVVFVVIWMVLGQC